MQEFAQRGQVTVLILLLALLGVTGALSVASRSLSDLRQVSQVETGTKALAAAEAGLQKTLGDLNAGLLPFSDATGCSTGAITGIQIDGLDMSDPIGRPPLTYSVCGNTADYVWENDLAADDVLEIDLSSISSNNVKDVAIVWENPAVAVEVSYVEGNGSLVRRAYNGRLVSAETGFVGAPTVRNDPATGAECIKPTAPYCAVGFSAGSNCVRRLFGSDQGGNGLKDDFLLRVKPIFGSTRVAVCGLAVGGSAGRLDVQHFVATVSARMTSGTVKRVSATKKAPALPGLFDNVIFSGRSISK